MAEQQEPTVDTMTARIGQVVMLLHGGDREEARSRFLDLWAELGEEGDALHRCTLAHFMADAQDDPSDELAWDLRALSAADELTDAQVMEHRQNPGSLAARAFYPSLHLNLAADYAKLGRREAARGHLGVARSSVGALGDDAYGDGIRAGIGRLESRLDREGPGGTPEPAPERGSGPGGGTLGPPRRQP